MQAQIKQLKNLAQGDLFGSDVRVVMNGGEPWFVAKDVCEILGIEWYRNAIASLDADEGRGVLVHTLGGDQEMAAVSESGLYALILRSRKPEAKAFKRWITHEVLPSLRKTGLYCGDLAGLDGALMTSRAYAHLRGLSGSVHGLGSTAKAVCRRSGMVWRERRKRGHEFPVAALDKAAECREAARGPLSQRPEEAVFFYDRSAARLNLKKKEPSVCGVTESELRGLASAASKASGAVGL